MIVTLIHNSTQSSPLFPFHVEFSPFRNYQSFRSRFLHSLRIPFVRILVIKFINLYNIHKGMYRWKCIVKGKLDDDCRWRSVALVYNDPLSLIILVTHYSDPPFPFAMVEYFSTSSLLWTSPSIRSLHAPFARIFMLRVEMFGRNSGWREIREYDIRELSGVVNFISSSCSLCTLCLDIYKEGRFQRWWWRCGKWILLIEGKLVQDIN